MSVKYLLPVPITPETQKLFKFSIFAKENLISDFYTASARFRRT